MSTEDTLLGIYASPDGRIHELHQDDLHKRQTNGTWIDRASGKVIIVNDNKTIIMSIQEYEEQTRK